MFAVFLVCFEQPANRQIVRLRAAGRENNFIWACVNDVRDLMPGLINRASGLLPKK